LKIFWDAMLPGLGGIDPKKMAGMMKKLGIKQDEISANRVVIEKEDGNIVIENPSVQKIEMQGQESWQVTGDVREELGVREGDVKLVMEKTGKSEEEVRASLEEVNGEVAEAIVKLSE
jgi:nascent polypeptide-associated complex subunit alpha